MAGAYSSLAAHLLHDTCRPSSLRPLLTGCTSSSWHMQIFKSEATHKHSLAWTWFSTIFAPTQQTLSVKDLDHSKSLSAGSLTPCMYRVWTKWLKVSLRLHVQAHVSEYLQTEKLGRQLHVTLHLCMSKVGLCIVCQHVSLTCVYPHDGTASIPTNMPCLARLGLCLLTAGLSFNVQYKSVWMCCAYGW